MSDHEDLELLIQRRPEEGNIMGKICPECGADTYVDGECVVVIDPISERVLFEEDLDTRFCPECYWAEEENPAKWRRYHEARDAERSSYGMDW
jgi:hypothetical protein